MALASSRLVVAFLLVSLGIGSLLQSGSQTALAAPAPTPTIPGIIGKPSPKPSPTPSDQEPEPEEKPKDQPAGDSREKPSRLKDPADRHRSTNARQKARTNGIPSWVRRFRSKGGYSTTIIDGVAMQLRALGWDDGALRKVYRGLPVGGPASWTDSWGAPRKEFGRSYRRHEGQDLFCERAAPLLAVQKGRIEFDTGALGGKVARLFLTDGSYWYYAHLSKWNTDEFSSGDSLRKGDVIGRCGTTGNAVGTPPHLHFGWYSGAQALNPIARLSAWLEQTEVRAQRVLRAVTRQRMTRMVALTTKRRFGDGLTPSHINARPRSGLNLLSLLLPSGITSRGVRDS